MGAGVGCLAGGVEDGPDIVVKITDCQLDLGQGETKLPHTYSLATRGGG